MGGHRRRDRVHRLGHLLHRDAAGHARRSRRLPPRASSQAPRDDAPFGSSERWSFQRWSAGSESRHWPNRAWTGAVVGCALYYDTGPLEHFQLVARCSSEHRATSIHSNIVARTLYGRHRPEHHSRHERNTRTVNPADFRRHSPTATATASGTGKVAPALRGRSVGGDCRRDRIHRVDPILCRLRALRASPLASSPPSPPRHVPARGRPAAGARRLAVQIPRRTPSPGHGPRFPRFPRRPGWTGWSGWPGCRSDWSRPHSGTEHPWSQHSAGTPLAAGRTHVWCDKHFSTGSRKGAY
jgi:hypothetical protein